MTAAETNKVDKGPNSTITSITGLTTALSIGQGGTGATTADAARATLGIPGRNKIINGDCNIAQRPSFTFTSNGTPVGYGGPDRFKVDNTTGGGITQSQGTITYGGIAKKAVVQTMTTSSTNIGGGSYLSGIMQIIEGAIAYPLLGQAATLSFIFNTNFTGTFSVAVRDGTSANSFVTTFAAVANTPVKVSLPILTIATTLNIPNSNLAGLIVSIGSANTGTYQTSTLNTWQTGNFFSASGSSGWCATTGNFISATEIQLESGTSASPYEHKPVWLNLLECRRYAYRQESGVGVAMGHYRANTVTASFVWWHPVCMRAAPSLYVSAAAAYNVYGTAGAPLSGSQSVVTSDVNTIRISVNTTAQGTDSPAMLAVASGQWHEISAEL
jgi:hypothetical protein